MEEKRKYKMNVKEIEGNRNFGYKVLQWEIVQHCNFHCDYCIVEAPKKEFKVCENYKDVIMYLNNHLINSKFFTVPRLWGGEPTLHPYFFDICDLFKIPFCVYSNMSQSEKFYEECLNFEHLQYFCCSLHLHSTSFEKYRRKLEILKNLNLHINIMLEHDRLEELEKIFKVLKEEFKNQKVKIKVIDKVNNYYHEEFYSQFSKYLINEQSFILNGKERTRFDIVKNELNNNEWLLIKNRIKCDINKYFNRIDIDGNLFNCMDGTKITDVYSNDFYKLEIPYILCHRRVCSPYMFEYGLKKELLK